MKTRPKQEKKKTQQLRKSFTDDTMGKSCLTVEESQVIISKIVKKIKYLQKDTTLDMESNFNGF